MTTGQQLQLEGLGRVKRSHVAWLNVMREIAREIHISEGEVTTDDLREIADSKALFPRSPNAWGAIFRTDEWEILGRKKSRHPSNHGREIKVWGLK